MLDHGLSGIVATPEVAVEHRAEFFLDGGDTLGSVLASLQKFECLVVALHNALDILATARTTLNLQDANTRLDECIEEVHRTQVLGREHILAIDIQLLAAILIRDGVLTAAYLAASTAVSRVVRLVLREVALTRHRHTHSAVCEHLNLNQLTRRATDVLLLNLLRDIGNLLQRQLACQHHDICPLREELNSRDVRDVALRRDVHLHAHLAGVEDGGKVGSDDGVDALSLCAVDDAAHNLHLRVVDNDVHREVGLDTRSVCHADNLRKVIEREVYARRSAHIELLNTEIYRVGTRIYRCVKRLVRAHRGHNLYIFSSNHHRLL